MLQRREIYLSPKLKNEKGSLQFIVLRNNAII